MPKIPLALRAVLRPALLSLLLAPAVVNAQSSEPPALQSACGCAEEFDSVVRKVETDYIGYRMMLPEMDRVAYNRLKENVRVHAARANAADCYMTLLPYVNYFHDGHVFLSEQSNLREQQIAQGIISAETLPWDEPKLRAYFEKNAKRLDLIEGIWYSDAYKIGIVRNHSGGQREFAAVMLTDNIKNWKMGQVKAEINLLPGGEYKGVFYFGDHSPHHLDGRVYKGLLLRMPPVIWGKEYPLRQFEKGLLDPKNPRSPTLKLLAGGTVVISMPSHSPEYGDALKALIAAHDADLRAAPLIIADIRGNEGGSAQTSDVLAPFYYSEKQSLDTGYVGHSVTLSSPDQINYFKAMAEQSDPQSDWGKTLMSLIGRLKQNPGKIIPLSEQGDAYIPTAKPENFSAQPRHFAILMDRGDVSAAEAFVLEVRRYERVSLFGENTGGTIDYQNVQMLPLDCRRFGFWLGFPTIGASNLLPKGGFNGVGIPPDVRIGNNVVDQIQFIVEYYAKGR